MDLVIWEWMYSRYLLAHSVPHSAAGLFCRVFKKEVSDLRASLRCFHTRASYDDDVLGILIDVRDFL